MPAPYDAIVIGAGVIGASIAFHLAREGLTNTLVLERDRVCSGNTRKSGALVRTHYSNVPEARLALGSLRCFQTWRETMGGDAGFQPVGFLVLVGPENEARLRRNVALQASLGINTRVVEARELREIAPSVVASEGVVGAFEAESGYADPIGTTHGYIRTAFNLGVTVLERVTVTEIRHHAGRVLGVSTNQGGFDAPIVVSAANIWSSRLLEAVGIDLQLTALRAQWALFRRPAELKPPARVVLDLDQLHYSRPYGDDLYLMGTPLGDRAVIDPERYDEQNDPGFPAQAQDRVQRRIPALASAAYVGGQAGLYDLSPDTRAIIDRAPTLEGLYFAAGFSGSGFKISPMVGAGLAELIVHGESRSVDIRPFRFSRFAENDPIQGTDEYELPASWGMKW